MAAMACQAVEDDNPCPHPAGYVVSLEEEGPDGAGFRAACHVCADHLAAAADWVSTRPTPYAGEAEDVYLTLYERRITVVALASGKSLGGSVSFEPVGLPAGAFPIR